jgi:hypothetical protein
MNNPDNWCSGQMLESTSNKRYYTAKCQKIILPAVNESITERVYVPSDSIHKEEFYNAIVVL